MLASPLSPLRAPLALNASPIWMIATQTEMLFHLQALSMPPAVFSE